MGKVEVEEDGPKGDVAEREHRVRLVDVGSRDTRWSETVPAAYAVPGSSAARSAGAERSGSATGPG